MTSETSITLVESRIRGSNNEKVSPNRMRKDYGSHCAYPLTSAVFCSLADGIDKSSSVSSASVFVGVKVATDANDATDVFKKSDLEGVPQLMAQRIE
jgi:hypothetical protein